jgi:hypothetical protein
VDVDGRVDGPVEAVVPGRVTGTVTGTGSLAGSDVTGATTRPAAGVVGLAVGTVMAVGAGGSTTIADGARPHPLAARRMAHVARPALSQGCRRVMDLVATAR